jgi:hypothetical protein
VLCAVLIPSRARPERLVKTLISIRDTVAAADQVETLIRIDDDDQASLAIKDELARRFKHTRVVVGPRETGYTSLAKFYTQLADASQAAWIFNLNDDATFQGHGWDLQLAALPTTGVIVQPEWITSGSVRGSVYRNVEGGPFPCVPNGCWRPDFAVMLEPQDTWLDDELRKRRGWSTRFLKGLYVHHARDRDEVLAVHRQLDSNKT